MDKNKNGWFYDFYPTIDKGYIMAGSARDSTQDGWLVKVDSLGIINPYVSQIIQPELPLNEITVYPNPFIDHTIIEIKLADLHGSNKLSFVMYDIYGRAVNIVDLPQSSSREIKYQLYRNGLTSGLYFYNVIQGNEIISRGKVIIH